MKMDRVDIGLKDSNGFPIHVGDVVEFYYCQQHKICSRDKECSDQTIMIDFVAISPNDGKPYFIFPGIGGAYAYRNNKQCRIVASLLDKEFFRLFSDFFSTTRSEVRTQ